MKSFLLRQSFFLLFAFAVKPLAAQSIQRSAFTSAGSYNQQLSVSLQSNIGEMVVATYSTPGNMLSQGFIQNDQLSVTILDANSGTVSGRYFPNPAVSSVTIELDHLLSGDLVIEVADVLGKNRNIPFSYDRQGSQTICRLDLSELSAGLYLVHIRSNSNQYDQLFRIMKI